MTGMGKQDLWDLFYKGTNPIHDLITSKGPHLLIPLHLELGFSVWICGITDILPIQNGYIQLHFFITRRGLSCLSSVSKVTAHERASVHRFRLMTRAGGVRMHYWQYFSVCFPDRYHNIFHWAIWALQTLPRQGPCLLSQWWRVLCDRNPDWIP